MATVTKPVKGRPLSFLKKSEDQLAREFLEDTADLLETNWTKGALHRDGDHCAVGGMIAVAHRKKYRGTGIYKRAKELLLNTLGYDKDHHYSPNHFIYLWNDQMAKGKEEVVRKFREASSSK